MAPGADAGTASPRPSRGRLRRGASADDTHVYFRPRTEHARERDALRHLHAWIDVHQPPAIHRNAFPADTPKAAPAPEPCGDAGLAAFAQLCAHRLNVHRALVTIITGSVEYVLSESTRTMSLMYDNAEDSDDALWLGTCSFPREAGMNSQVIHTWRKARRFREPPAEKDYYYTEGKSPHLLMVSDTCNNEGYKACTFVQRAPFLRFYCSVPLRDITGSVIGSLSLLDDKPRYGVSAQELLFLEDSADNIAEHLEACVVRSQRQRSERLIQALGLFNNRKSSLREWWLDQDDQRIQRGGRYKKTTEDDEDQKARADEEFGVQDPDLSDTTVASRRRLRRKGSMETDTETTVILETASDATTGNQSAADVRDGERVGGQDFDQRPLGDPVASPHFVGENFTVQPSKDRERRVPHHSISQNGGASRRKSSLNASDSLQHTYARATNLMREALGAEAVVCVDARAVSSGLKYTSKDTPDHLSNRGGHQNSGPDSESSSDRPFHEATSDTDGSGDEASGSRICKVNGFSTRTRSTLTGTPSIGQQFGLTNRELRRMIKRYPRGKIFNFEETGNLYSSSGDEGTSGSNGEDRGKGESSSRLPKTRHHQEAQRLGKVMIGARTIAFYPIFDDTSESWRSCIFVWSCTPMRFFDPVEDLTYLTTFAHSLVAELSRLETLASDAAKSTFISSMSHELRSPLHGVLAGIELLQDSSLNSFQQEMATTVAVAGRTLLDTVNHILDYSKISQLTKRQRNDRIVEDASRHNGTTKPAPGETGAFDGDLTVDLARLTEEIVETVTAGYRYMSLSKRNSTSSGGSSRRSSVESKSESAAIHGHSVSVVLNIEKRSNWNVTISPGAWTRILTNLVGNALKYTPEGLIAIELTAGDIVADSSSLRGPVTLTVRDSGIGMSEQFLESGLYTPFKQVNTHSSGTGLGLSIVKQIAKEMRADLDVQSQLGKGTSMQLRFQARFDSKSTEGAHTANGALFSPELNRRSFHLFIPNTKLPFGSEAAGVVGLSVLRSAENWLACMTSSGTDLEMIKPAGICALSEGDLIQLCREDQTLLKSLLSQLSACDAILVVLGRASGSTSEVDFEGFPVKHIFLQQPIGPRKLCRALESVADASTPRAVTDESSPHASLFRPMAGLEGNNTSASFAKQRADSFPWHSNTTNRFANSGESSSLSPGMMLRRKSSHAPTSVQTGDYTAGSKSPQSPAVMTPSVLAPSQEGSTDSLGSVARDEDAAVHSTVLLVEDNELNMRLLVALMKKLKLHYHCAANGLEAYTIYTMSPSDFFLVLMDVDMPVMNGNTSATKIREFERKQKLRHTTIVALTGVTSAESKAQCLNAGMDQFFTKPIRMKDLSTLVAEVQESLDR